MGDFADEYWWSRDGLRLHYRDYPGPADQPLILCIPGLTRNARDFHHLAMRVAGRFRVVAIDLRGRGESAYAADPMTYVPLTYLQDIEALLDQLGVAKVVVIGTSLGGLLAMLMAGSDRGRLAGAVINDVGPVIDAAGLGRIRGYVGRPQTWPTWLHAARAIAETNKDIFPDYRLDDWLAMAKRLARLTAGGRIVLDYDMKIAEPFRVPGGEDGGVDMWPAFDALRIVPVLAIRGDRSDLLSAATFDAMRGRNPGLVTVTVPRTGHAPTLDEPEAAQAIDEFLEEVVRLAA